MKNVNVWEELCELASLYRARTIVLLMLLVITSMVGYIVNYEPSVNYWRILIAIMFITVIVAESCTWRTQRLANKYRDQSMKDES
jgi:heme O synthase-like polyprenyltransferase